MSGFDRVIAYAHPKSNQPQKVPGFTPRKSNTLRLNSWITQNFRIVRVCEMDDKHLVNCIKYILRNAPKKWFAVGVAEVGISQKSLHDWWGENTSWVAMVPEIIKDMVAEANDRGLPIEMSGEEYRHVTSEALTILFDRLLEGPSATNDSDVTISPRGRSMSAGEIESLIRKISAVNVQDRIRKIPDSVMSCMISGMD